MVGQYHRSVSADSAGGLFERRCGSKREASRKPRRETRGIVCNSLDDFLKRCPFSRINQYGDRVISGTRIC
jgi:hypothetical protein